MAVDVPQRTVLDLTGLLSHAAHVMTTRLTAALSDVGLTPRMQCVLVHAMEQERTQIQLAELAHMDKTTMVVTMDELESSGLAVRRPSVTDRRARIVAVTDEGARMARVGQEIVDRVHAEVLGAVPDGSGAVFGAALEGLVGGELARPVDCDRPVRRARQARR